MLKYIGGNLVVGNSPSDEIDLEFSKYGFDRVFHRPKVLNF